jgi:hypothetical protein
MPSAFGWVDFLAEDRQKMLDVVHLFHERETRDELGLGTIRDAFSDHFFPGTSTVQTRVRYMLFVSWVYQRLEQKKVPSAQVAEKARGHETWLINELVKTEPGDGVIGSEAGKGLKRLPSNIYWSGLGAWGIRLFEGSQEEYHRYLDTYQRQATTSRYAGEADEEFHDSKRQPNWHPGLPKPPKPFPQGASLALTREEALYLRDRILALHGETLLAALLRKKKQYKAAYPWELPIVPELRERLQQDLTHAENFSEVMHGAALLYNLLLSRMRGNKAWISKYENRMAQWSGGISARRADLKAWQKNMDAFWRSPTLENARISLPTRRFVETWAAWAVDAPGPHKMADHGPAETLLREREVALKHSRARLEHPRPLELWQGASGTNPYNYRWPVASSFVEDILKGLRQEKTHA